jgi:hypothetical protein
MTYTFDEPRLGVLQIANTDAGYTTANGTALAIPTPPVVLGSIVRAFDPTYGEGEFICLKGVASTAVGSLVIWDATTYQTALCPSTANLARPVAVSMAATTAALYGWYQIGGSAVVLKSVNHNIQPNVAVGVYSTGKIATTSSSGAGKEIEGARFTAAATAASAATTCVIVIDRPQLQGRIT